MKRQLRTRVGLQRETETHPRVEEGVLILTVNRSRLPSSGRLCALARQLQP